MSTYLISVRAIENNSFLNKPGATHYLHIPDSAAIIETTHIIEAQSTHNAAEIWLSKIADHHSENIAVYVHGYNYCHEQLLYHLRVFNKELTDKGFKGIVIGFDWPSAKLLVNYIEDRMYAKKCAAKLIEDCIWPLLQHKKVNLHLLAHSTGVYIVKQAFKQTQDIAHERYKLDRIVFFAGDVSQQEINKEPIKSMILNHCEALINYSNQKDEALEAADSLRLGLAPRIGQVGLAKKMSQKCTNKSYTAYFRKIAIHGPNKIFDPIHYAYFTHMWYFEDHIWLQDIANTLSKKHSQLQSILNEKSTYFFTTYQYYHFCSKDKKYWIFD